MKAYFTLNGANYYGYEVLLYLDKEELDKEELGNVALLDDEAKELFDKKDSSLYSQITPPKGSTIYLTKNSPVAIDDIRKNYSIKRHPDTADYNVFNPLKEANRNTRWKYSMLIDNYNKIVVLSGYRATHAYFACKSDLLTVLQQRYPTKPFYDAYLEYSDTAKLFNICYFFPEHEMLMAGTLSKPSVHVYSLDYSTGNERNVDTLMLLYEASKQDKKAFELQLKGLNQTNWRDFPGTMYMFFGEFMQNSIAYKDFCKVPSCVTKSLKPFLNVPKHDWDTKADWELSSELLKKVLNIDRTRLTTLPHAIIVAYKLMNDIGIFTTFFDALVKITPKTYEEKTEGA